jgi:nitroimidazol reductase NimA-like FMN-containing flavoprotein (pyridoxamine 5'-phosphate oxidase superfamily)
VTGRIRSNIESDARVCFEASELGKMLPSNVALEFSLQFRSVIIFGSARLINDPEEARRVMYGLIHKYFPTMTAGKEFREMTDKELQRTSVYVIQISVEQKTGRPCRPMDEYRRHEEWFQ